MDEKYSRYIKVKKDFDPVFKWDADNKDEMFMDFYPHETFIKLIKRVLESFDIKQKSIWVSGSYGTGKSYASWTLEKLLEVPEVKLDEYFSKFNDLLSSDLLKQVKNLRNKNIVVVNRTGTSSVNSDAALCYGIQESVANILKQKGYEYTQSLKEMIIAKFENDVSFEKYFDSIIEEKYKSLFGKDRTKDLLKKIKENTNTANVELINNILKVADENGLRLINITIDSLIDWLTDVINENNIRILFIWDEFTEFITNNSTRLTGFQRLGELIKKVDFAFMVITHKAPTQILSDNETGKKISDRFNYDCKIELPEEQGIKLMASAINILKDNRDKEEWESIVETLSNRIKKLCTELNKNVRITFDEYKNVLPIHPYATLVLRVISEKFGSNQRSMFDFMKQDKNIDECKGFIWFIENYGPNDNDNPFLTIDMLWDYFYKNGKDKLDSDSLNILSYYDVINPNEKNDKIDKYQRRILKTILLLNVIQKIQGNQDTFYSPNMDNIKNTFVGTDVYDNVEVSIEKLKNDNIINTISVNGVLRYFATQGSGDETEINKSKENNLIKFKNTKAVLDLLIDEEQPLKFDATSFLSAKFNFINADVSTYKKHLQPYGEKDNVIFIISFNKEEHDKLIQDGSIDELLKMYKNNIIIDATNNFMSEDEKNKFIDYYTRYLYYQNNDKNQSLVHKGNYTNILRKWVSKIENGDFVVYYLDNKETVQTVNINSFRNIKEQINDIIINVYPLGLENVLKQNYKFSGGDIYRFINNKSICFIRDEKLPASLGSVGEIEEVLNDKNYMKTKSNLIISKIKVKFDEFMDDKLNNGVKEVSLSEIWHFLYEKPFGFRNQGAYGVYLAFLLKDYIMSGNYKFADSVGYYNDLNKDNISAFAIALIDTIHKKSNSEKAKIVSEPEELKKLFEILKKAFNILKCNNIGELRDGLRERLKEYSFPLWVIEYSDEYNNLSNKNYMKEVIDKIVLLMNNNDKTSENSIGIEMGGILLKSKELCDDCVSFFTKDNVINGMKNYTRGQSPQVIELSKKIQDEGLYLSLLKDKFNANGNWLWDQSTGFELINLTKDELQIIDTTNEILNLHDNSIHKTIESWIYEVNKLIMSYDLIKDEISKDDSALYDFFEVLCNLYRNSELNTSQYNSFYEKLSRAKTSYEKYRNGEKEFDIFCKTFDSKIIDFSTDERKELFKKLNNGFMLNKNEFSRNAEQTIQEYKKSKKKLKLCEKFKEISGYDNPKSFENNKKTPIMIFVSDGDKEIAKSTFETINGNKNTNEDEIDRLIAYIDSAKYLTKLNNDDYIDKIFKNQFLQDFQLVLNNVDEVRNYLYKKEPNVSNWYNDYKSISQMIKAMAKEKYIEKDYSKAYEKIDKMSDNDVKKYLKELIKDNMEVGLSIMKSSVNNE